MLMPRVVMKDSTRNRAMIQPFTQPTTRLMSTGSRKHRGRGMPPTAIKAHMTPPREAMEPMDRSNSLMLMTRVAPMEMMTIREI